MTTTTQPPEPALARPQAFLAEHRIERLRIGALDLLGREQVVDVLPAGFAAALAGRLELAPAGVAGAGEAAVRLAPDLTTLVQLPAAVAGGRRSAALVAELAGDGVACPRRALRSELQAFHRTPLRLRLAALVELHLLEPAADGGWQPLAGGVQAAERAGAFALELADVLQVAGIEVVALRPCPIPGQVALELAALDPLAAADALAGLRSLARRLARTRGLLATFLPRPVAGAPGSALHLQFDLCDEQGASALLAGLPPARAFLAGILDHAAALCFLTNRLINSYKRLLPGRAGSLIAWGSDGRLPMLRVCERARLPAELRSPDPACQPYLALAGLLAAGRDGVERNLELAEPVAATLAELPRRERARLETLPSSLHEAILAFAQDDLLAAALGGPIVEPLLAQAKREWAGFADAVHPFELAGQLEQI